MQANGLCDNLITCIVRAWDFSKPLLVAPAMNTYMWDSPFTSQHLGTLRSLGVTVIPPVSKVRHQGSGRKWSMTDGNQRNPSTLLFLCTSSAQRICLGCHELADHYPLSALSDYYRDDVPCPHRRWRVGM